MNIADTAPSGGTHFRRMDPQPTKAVAISTQAGRRLVVNVDTPVDMPGAQPWKDRDGEWYWRAPIGNVA